ncbi:MAG TPA: hypothetical protein DD670_08310, partial [Planctomycetaceae bacterium]|nr:hypothetical protein [Planctomycetaceae bacterium]
MSARTHYLAVATLLSLAATYFTLIPFEFQAVSWDEAVRSFARALPTTVRPISPSNFAANVLFFVPLGYGLAGALLVDRRGHWAAIRGAVATMAMCFVVSVLLEFSQVWFPSRHPSASDILAQQVGALLGMGLWLGAGQWITDTIRDRVARAGSVKLVEWLLYSYLLGFVIYHLFPFDFVVQPGAVFRKYAAGQIGLA